MAGDIKKSEWLRCDLYPNKVWTVVRKIALYHIVIELYGRRETTDSLGIEPNLCLWTGRVVHVVPGLVRPDYRGECSFTVHTEDSVAIFHTHSEKSMVEWVNLLKRLLPRNDNDYTSERSRIARAVQNRPAEAAATATRIVEAAPAASATVDYGHVSGAPVQSISPAVRRRICANTAASAGSEANVGSEMSGEASPPEAQRPRPKVKTTAVDPAARAAGASNSTRDPTSPLPPTPDVSESVYGAVYPTQPISNHDVAVATATRAPLTETSGPQRAAAGSAPCLVGTATVAPEDSLYGHLSNCSSSDVRSNLDKTATSIFSRMWPLNWWKFSKK